jgi:hypothetical protein
MMVVVGFGAIAASASAAPVIGDFLTSLWEPATPAIGSTDSLYLADRGEIFMEATSIFLADPVFGIGFGTYFAGYQGFVGPSAGEVYPHNLLLNIAVDTGVLGLVPAVVAAICCLSSVKPTANLESVAAFAGTAYAFALAMFNGTYYDHRLLWAFAVLLIVAAGTPCTALSGQRATALSGQRTWVYRRSA